MTPGEGESGSPAGRGPEWPVPPDAMEPVLWPEPFDDPRFAFQVKWDGIRILTWVDGRAVRALTRRGRPRERAYPELGALVPGPPAVYDGEMVVLSGGRPSFPAVLRRDRASSPAAVSALARSRPAVYQVFDLLWTDGQDLRGTDWERRQERLWSAVKASGAEDGGTVALVHSWPGQDGRALFEAASELGLEGIVAKERASPYLPGRKSDRWRKVKAWRTRDAVVGGYLAGSDGLASLLVGAYEGPFLRYLGRAGSGLADAERRALRSLLDEHACPASPFRPAPERLPGRPRWADPILVVRVRFQEWTPDLHLRAPVVLGPAPGVDPATCQLDTWGGEGDGRT